MRCRYFIREITIGFCRELVHHYAEHSSSALVRATTRSFHHAQIATRADSKSCIGQKLTDPSGLSVFGIKFTTFRAAKNCDDSLGYEFFVTQTVSLRSSR